MLLWKAESCRIGKLHITFKIYLNVTCAIQDTNLVNFGSIFWDWPKCYLYNFVAKCREHILRVTNYFYCLEQISGTGSTF